MNVISAIFALLGIVAFIVDLNLNGLYRSSFDDSNYHVLVSKGGGARPAAPHSLCSRSCAAQGWLSLSGTSPGRFSIPPSPSPLRCCLSSFWGGGFARLLCGVWPCHQGGAGSPWPAAPRPWGCLSAPDLFQAGTSGDDSRPGSARFSPRALKAARPRAPRCPQSQDAWGGWEMEEKGSPKMWGGGLPCGAEPRFPSPGRC